MAVDIENLSVFMKNIDPNKKFTKGPQNEQYSLIRSFNFAHKLRTKMK